MTREKVARALSRRPADSEFRQQVFWLVDIIYSCKASDDPELVEKSQLLEDALGALGGYLDTGDDDLLTRVNDSLGAFARFVTAPVDL